MKWYLYLFFLLISMPVFGQCPNLDLSFYSQDEIDQFGQDYPNCDALETVFIRGNVNNLLGLSQLTSIVNLAISETKLERLDGLNNIKIINNIKISKNNWLNSLSVLDLISSPYRIEILHNPRLKDCDLLCKWLDGAMVVDIRDNAIGCSHKYDLQCDDYVRGSIFYDKNQNKIQDDDEYGIPNIFAQENSQGFWRLSNSQGGFGFKALNGMKVEVEPRIDYNQWMLTTDATSYSYVYGSSGTKNELFFGLVPREKKHELDVSIFRVKGLNFSILVKNNGAFKESGKLLMSYDELLTLDATYPELLVNDGVNRKAKWEFSDIPPFGKKEFNIKFNTTSTLSQEHELKVHLEGLGDDLELPSAKKMEWSRQWFGYFPYGCDFSSNPSNNERVSTDDFIDYQFSYSAVGQNVVVSEFNNELDSFEFVFGDIYPEIKIDGSTIRFGLTTIDIFANQFLAYRVKPKIDLVEETVLKNRISKLTSPFCAESLQHTIISPLRSWEVSDHNLLLGPNPTSSFFRMQYNVDYVNSDSKLLIYNSLGQLTKSFSVISNKRYFVNDLPSGFYTVMLYTSDAKRKIHAGKLFIQ